MTPTQRLFVTALGKLDKTGAALASNGGYKLAAPRLLGISRPINYDALEPPRRAGDAPSN
jgi:hypothetical protein